MYDFQNKNRYIFAWNRTEHDSSSNVFESPLAQEHSKIIYLQIDTDIPTKEKRSTIYNKFTKNHLLQYYNNVNAV